MYPLLLLLNSSLAFFLSTYVNKRTVHPCLNHHHHHHHHQPKATTPPTHTERASSRSVASRGPQGPSRWRGWGSPRRGRRPRGSPSRARSRRCSRPRAASAPLAPASLCSAPTSGPARPRRTTGGSACRCRYARAPSRLRGQYRGCEEARVSLKMVFGVDV